MIAGPLPIVTGSGAPARVLALVERAVNVAEAVGETVVALGVDHVFGVVGSGNFHVTNAMIAQGARFVAARHEGGAATMADAYARTCGSVAAVTRPPGLRPHQRDDRHHRGGQEPHAAARARRRGRREPRSNFYVDQAGLAARGRAPCRSGSRPATARWRRRPRLSRRPVISGVRSC